MAKKKQQIDTKRLIKALPATIIIFIFSIVLLIAVLIEAGIYPFKNIPEKLNFDIDFSNLFPGKSIISNDIKTDTDFPLSVYFLDVGQGDSELIVAGDTSVLIDAGETEYGNKVLQSIKSLGIEKLDYIIATHPHSDHIGGMATVISGIDFDKIIVPRVDSSQTPTSTDYENFLKAVKEKDKKLTPATAGKKYELGNDVILEILAPTEEYYDDLNNYSIVCKISYESISYLFTGDASSVSEKAMLENGYDLSADVLKVGHHGSKSASTKKFIEAVNPSVCVIEVGAGNSYGHPNDSIVERLTQYTDSIYRTDINGTIVIHTDGKQLYIKTSE